MLQLRSFKLILLYVIAVNSYGAETYRPTKLETIIAELPESVVQLASQVRNQNSGGQAKDTQELTSQIFTTYQIAKRTNDARAYGHLLTLLESWPRSQPMPSMARLINASVLQHNHQFDAAIEVLENMNTQNASDLNTIGMLAQIRITTGDYEAAREMCLRLEAMGYDISAFNCRTQLDGLTGNAESALQKLQETLQQRSLNQTQTIELHTTAADIANRIGEPDAARWHYHSALTLAPDNLYLLLNYSDWLLAVGNPDKVVELLQSWSSLDTELELKMLYARALLATQQREEFQSVYHEIEQSILAMSRRGDDRPHKLIASFQLSFSENIQIALTEAKANWSEQKEPSDLRLLAEAAIAAGDHQGVSLVKEWREQTGLQDWRLDLILARDGVH